MVRPLTGFATDNHQGFALRSRRRAGSARWRPPHGAPPVGQHERSTAARCYRPRGRPRAAAN